MSPSKCERMSLVIPSSSIKWPPSTRAIILMIQVIITSLRQPANLLQVNRVQELPNLVNMQNNLSIQLSGAFLRRNYSPVHSGYTLGSHKPVECDRKTSKGGQEDISLSEMWHYSKLPLVHLSSLSFITQSALVSLRVFVTRMHNLIIFIPQGLWVTMTDG